MVPAGKPPTPGLHKKQQPAILIRIEAEYTKAARKYLLSGKINSGK
jgi:hypothetical protein